jgi:outer membrane protein OmpA-like peptidoglycan-associated protein
MFVLIVFLLAVLVLSVTTFRSAGVQGALAGLEDEARAILDHPGHARKFQGLTVRREQLDVILEGAAEKEVRAEAMRLLGYGDKRLGIRGLRAGVVVNRVVLDTPDPPELEIRLEPPLVTLRGRVPEAGNLRGRLDEVVKQMGWQPLSSGLRASRDVDGGEWFAAAPQFVEAFLAGASTASLRLTPDGLSLARSVSDERARGELLAKAKLWLPPGFPVDAEGLTLVPGLRVRRGAEGWVVEGAVADEPSAALVRQAVEEADTASAGKNDYTLLQVVPGMPVATWLRRVPPFLAQFMAGVRDGADLVVTASEVTMAGDVPDLALASRLVAAAEGVFGPSMKVRSWLLNPANPVRRMSFELGQTAAADIVVTGGVPNPQVAKQFEDALRASYPGRKVDASGLRVDAAAQYEPWIDGLVAFLREFARRSQGTGTLKLDVRRAELGGVVPNEITRDALRLRLEEVLGPSFTVVATMKVDAKAEVPEPYVVERVFFGDNQSAVPKAEEAKLAAFAGRAAAEGQTGTILVKGFGSQSGSAAVNLAISARRAEAVRADLARRGVPEARMEVLAMGKAAPGRSAAEERRVELILLE